MKLIISFNKRQLRNAEHVQLHTNVLKLVQKAGIENLGLQETLFESYRQAITKEQDIVNRAAGSIYTKEMESMNKVRTRIYSRIRAKLALCSLEFERSEAYKAKDVVETQLLSKYPATIVNRLAYQEKTAVYAGFIMDARSVLTAPQIENIRIDADLDDLEATNKQFNDLYQERVKEKAEAEGDLAQQLRAACDEYFTLVSLFINAQANDILEANKAKAEACQSVIGLINVVIEDTRQRLNQRLGGGADAGEEGSGSTASGSDSGSGSTPDSGNNSGTGSDSGSGSDIFVPGSPDDVME